MMGYGAPRILIVDADNLLAVHLAHELGKLDAGVPNVALALRRALEATGEADIGVVIVDPLIDDGSAVFAFTPWLDRGVPVIVKAICLLLKLLGCSFVQMPYNLQRMAVRLSDAVAAQH